MKTEVRRGRKFVEYHDPETQDEFTFTQEISGADVSYQDESGNWLAADENWATDGVDGFILKNDKLNHKVRLKGTGGRNWYPRRNVNTEYMTFGVPQYWNGKRWTNFGFSGWSVEGKTITLNTRQGVTILVHNRWNGIKIDWVLASSAAPSRMRYAVSLTGITEIEGVLFGADGTELGRLTPTTATDSTFDEEGMPTQLPCSGSYSGGYVEFQADVTEASFPVTIDPDFTGGDAFYIMSQSTDYSTARTTSATSGAWSNRTEVGQGQWSIYHRTYRLYITFDTSSIGASSTVTQVNLKLTPYSNNSQTDFDLQICMHDWSGQNPIISANREAAWDGCLAETDYDVWLNSADCPLRQSYTGGNMTTAWINKTGKTYYSLRSSRDYNGDVRTLDGNTESLVLCAPDNATEAYRPVLSVTYTAGSTGVPKHFLHYARLRSN